MRHQPLYKVLNEMGRGSRQQLSYQIESPAPYVSDIAAGRLKPGQVIMRRISEALGLPVEALFHVRRVERFEAVWPLPEDD